MNADQKSRLLVTHSILERKTWVQQNALEMNFPQYFSIPVKTNAFISFL